MELAKPRLSKNPFNLVLLAFEWMFQMLEPMGIGVFSQTSLVAKVVDETKIIPFVLHQILTFHSEKQDTAFSHHYSKKKRQKTP